MRIYNGTPHSINFIANSTFDPSIRKWVGGEEIMCVPSDGMLNVKFETEESVLEGTDIPLFEKKVVGIDPLPEGYDVIIVSALYGTNYEDKSHLYGVSDPVMTSDGKSFVGCRGLQKF